MMSRAALILAAIAFAIGVLSSLLAPLLAELDPLTTTTPTQEQNR